MTALWTNGNGNRNGDNDSRGDCLGGDGGGLGDSHGDSRKLGYGYPEQAYDGCTAIGRLLAYEAALPVADLLALAVAR